jgi:hypothetical protein
MDYTGNLIKRNKLNIYEVTNAVSYQSITNYLAMYNKFGIPIVSIKGLK